MLTSISVFNVNATHATQQQRVSQDKVQHFQILWYWGCEHINTSCRPTT